MEKYDTTPPGTFGVRVKIVKWVNGFTDREKIRRKEEWHTWFAWFPVVIGEIEGRKKKVWWERVLRRGEYHGYIGDCYWTYGYKEKNENGIS